MSIAVTDVETRVRQITRRDNTANLSDDALDALILETCIDISIRLLNLDETVTGTLSGDGTTITAPTDMVMLDSGIKELYLGDRLQDPITYAEWRAGAVPGRAFYDGVIYISPTDDNDRTYTLTYFKKHGALSTNLEFKDELRMAVTWLTAKKVFDNFFTPDSQEQSTKASQEHEREIFLNAPAEVTISNARVNSRP